MSEPTACLTLSPLTRENIRNANAVMACTDLTRAAYMAHAHSRNLSAYAMIYAGADEHIRARAMRRAEVLAEAWERRTEDLAKGIDTAV